MANILYGIKNCDAIKKARRYLDDHAVDYQFHDYRVDGIDQKMVQSFCDNLGWEIVLNKRGTTWRGLDEKTKAATDESNIAALLCQHPAMIKRPILKSGNKLLIGFSKKTITRDVQHWLMGATNAAALVKQLQALADTDHAKKAHRYFKTGPGDTRTVISFWGFASRSFVLWKKTAAANCLLVIWKPCCKTTGMRSGYSP